MWGARPSRLIEDAQQVGPVTGQLVEAIEASSVLHLGEDGAHRFEYGPLRTEERLVQVGGFAKYAKVLLPHVPDPRTSYQVGD
jgi:hypothetical protein